MLRGYVNGSNDWRYRYTASGEREGKRKYQSAQANKPLAWVYYLLGGSKDQLSVWHGLEKPNSCGTTGTNVFLYPVEYLTYGTGNNLSTRTNGQKEYKLMDHLGSTRVVLDNNGITQEYDYDPFGRQVVVTAATTGGPAREGFIGKEKDSEDNLGDFGVRKYDESLGRFMSTDVLWEKYRGLTPYQYGGNNPTNSKDPSGFDQITYADADIQEFIGNSMEAVARIENVRDDEGKSENILKELIEKEGFEIKVKFGDLKLDANGGGDKAARTEPTIKDGKITGVVITIDKKAKGLGEYALIKLSAHELKHSSDLSKPDGLAKYNEYIQERDNNTKQYDTDMEKSAIRYEKTALQGYIWFMQNPEYIKKNSFITPDWYKPTVAPPSTPK